MSAAEQPEQLAFHLRRLRLSGILDTLEVRTQQAIAEHWSYVAFLTRLVQDEAERREHQALGLRLRRGQVNGTKTLETFDFDFGFNPTGNRQQIFDLATCAFIRHKRPHRLRVPSLRRALRRGASLLHLPLVLPSGNLPSGTGAGG
jgi:IstB-like ATP binding protein